MRIRLGELDERDLAPLGVDDLHHRTAGPPALREPRGRHRRGRQARPLRVGRGALPRRGRRSRSRLLSAACLLEESFSASRLAGVLDLDTGRLSRTSSTASVCAGCCRSKRALPLPRTDLARVPGRQPLARFAQPAREPHRARRAAGPEREADGERREASAASHDGRAPRKTARSRPRVEPGLAS